MHDLHIFTDNALLITELQTFLADTTYRLTAYPRAIPSDETYNQAAAGAAVVLDLSDSPGEVSLFVQSFKTHMPFTPLIVLVETGDVEAAVNAVQAGASTALALPLAKQAFLKALADATTRQTIAQEDYLFIRQAINLLQSFYVRRGFPEVPGLRVGINPLALSPGRDLRLGDLIIRESEEKAYYRTQLLDLTPSQFRLLAYLAQAQGRLVPFEELYYHLHGLYLDRSSARTALTAHLSYLRAKLQAVGCGAYLINVRGRGYTFKAPEESTAAASPPSLEDILGQLPIVIWTTDTQFHLTSLLGATITDVGLTQDAVLHWTPEDAFAVGLDYPRFLDGYQQALLGKTTSFEQELDGRTFSVFIKPNFDADDQLIGCIGLALDITHRQPD